MFYLSDICCVCLNTYNELRRVSAADSDGTSYLIKLCSFLPGLVSSIHMNERLLICEGCSNDVDFVYQFQRKCVTNRLRLSNYMSILNSGEKTEAVISIRITDIFGNIKQEKTLNPKYETEDVIPEIRKTTSDITKKNNDTSEVHVKTEIFDLEIENTISSNVQVQTGTPKISTECCDDIKIENFDLKMEVTANIESEKSENLHDTCTNPNDLKDDIEICYRNLSAKRMQAESRFELATDGVTHKQQHHGNFASALCEQTLSSVPLAHQAHDVSNSNLSNENLYEDTNKFIANMCDVHVAQKSLFTSHTKDVGSELSSESSLQEQNGGTICPKKFIDTNLASHDCLVCHKFSYRKAFEQHMLRHNVVKTYECSVCHKNFARSSHLQLHMLAHSGDKPYECNICQRRFTQSSNLNVHLATHSGVKPYECNVCQKKFIQSSNLKVHMLTHTGEKPHECSHCHKKFTRHNSLKIHMLTHSEVKPYHCNICQKTFTQSKSLNRHLLIHSGVRQHECNICQKKFAQSGNLQTHMLTHSGVKPHTCIVCQKKFTQISHLKAHMLLHSKTTPHECNVCQKKFRLSSSLKKHSLIHLEIKSCEKSEVLVQT